MQRRIALIKGKYWEYEGNYRGVAGLREQQLRGPCNGATLPNMAKAICLIISCQLQGNSFPHLHVLELG